MRGGAQADPLNVCGGVRLDLLLNIWSPRVPEWEGCAGGRTCPIACVFFHHRVLGGCSQ